MLCAQVQVISQSSATVDRVFVPDPAKEWKCGASCRFKKREKTRQQTADGRRQYSLLRSYVCNWMYLGVGLSFCTSAPPLSP